MQIQRNNLKYESRERSFDELGSNLSQLAAQADVADRTYTVQSKVPLVSSYIASIRRHMTSHLREPYFDIIIERQVQFNHKLFQTLSGIYHVLKVRDKLIALPPRHPSQDIIDEASRTKPKDVIQNPYCLAGPLPEYGDCLGQDFYEILYAASLLSASLGSKEQKRVHEKVLIDLYAIARKTEEHDELSRRRRETLAFSLDLLETDVILREFNLFSDQRVVGQFIVWVRRHLTSHLREPYVDPILEKQVHFNKLVVESLAKIYSSSPITFAELESRAKITKDSYVVHSDKPIIGPLIISARKALTSHLREPYIEPIFKRQEKFNLLVVEVLTVIRQYATSVDLKEHNESPNSKLKIMSALSDLKKSYMLNRAKSSSATERGIFDLFMFLLNKMSARMEERL